MTVDTGSSVSTFRITILAILRCVWPFALVARLNLHAAPASRTTYAPMCAQCMGSPVAERGCGREPSARAACRKRAIGRASRRAHQQPAEPPPTGSARVTGRVLARDNGVFDFPGLPGGSYYISTPGTNGFGELPRAKQASVGEGQSLEIAIRLERAGAIVGRITDRNGERLLGVEVTAISRKDFRGHVTLMAVLTARVLRVSTNLTHPNSQ